jgi:predicted Zn-dependent protease
LKANLFEAAGRRPEADKTLEEALRHAPSQPRIVERAVPLLCRLNRKPDALKLIEQATRSDAQQADLLLMKAIVLGLMGRSPAAEKTLLDVELRWPEWDRAYLVHGLLSESVGRAKEARQKLQTAAALGLQHPALTCALARLGGHTPPRPECACSTGLEQLLSNNCTQ